MSLTTPESSICHVTPAVGFQYVPLPAEAPVLVVGTLLVVDDGSGTTVTLSVVTVLEDAAAEEAATEDTVAEDGAADGEVDAVLETEKGAVSVLKVVRTEADDVVLEAKDGTGPERLGNVVAAVEDTAVRVLDGEPGKIDHHGTVQGGGAQGHDSLW